MLPPTKNYEWTDDHLVHSVHWELIGGDMSVSRSSKSWIDTWCAGYSVQHWGLSGGVISDTGTPTNENPLMSEMI